jgi:hypothetical protein
LQNSASTASKIRLGMMSLPSTIVASMMASTESILVIWMALTVAVHGKTSCSIVSSFRY